jgi:hypothetical protein
MASIINASTSSGIVQTADTSGILQLQTASTTAVTVDASQNVGIGTTTPAGNLGVAGTVFLGNQASSGSTGTGKLISTAGALYIQSGLNTTNGSVAPIIFTDMGNSVERMRIDSSGVLLVGLTSVVSGQGGTSLQVGCTASNQAGYFQNSNASPYGVNIKFSSASPNTGGNEFIAAIDSTATRMTLRSNGGIANYQANNVNLSDATEKTNVKLAGSYLDKICAIPVKTFNYIDQNMEQDGGLTLGVIAQDVQEVAPELITESNWGTEEEPKERLSIYQTDLQYALMKCIQEQQQIITDLKATVDSHVAIINDLKARITALEGAK